MAWGPQGLQCCLMTDGLARYCMIEHSYLRRHTWLRRCSCLCIVFQHAYSADPPPLQAKYALPRGGGPAPRTTRIFVARIPPMVSDVEFRQYFERFGQVQVSQHSLSLYQLLVHDSCNPCLSSPSCSCYDISNLSWCKGTIQTVHRPFRLALATKR